MIDETFAKEQVARLSNLPFFPQMSVSVRDLIMALQSAKDQAIAKATIDEFVASVGADSRCPTAADIRRAAYSKEVQAAKDYEHPGPTRCTDCDDTGYKRKVHEVRGALYDFAVPCACRQKPAEVNA